MLQCRQLSYHWHGKFGLQKINFDFATKGKLGIIGPNGAGKSTLLKLLAGQLRPISGQLLIQGADLHKLSSLSRAKQLAFLDQHFEIPLGFTVQECAALGVLPHKRPWQGLDQTDIERINKALTLTGLNLHAQKTFSQLSGGEMQRAMLARVLVQGAALLLMDEPTNHLDVQFQHQLLSQLSQFDLSWIASFHDVNLAASYCDHLLLLDQGRQISLGTVSQVLKAEILEQVYQRRCIVDHNPFDQRPRVTFAPGNMTPCE